MNSKIGTAGASLYQSIYALVCQIPPGYVTTYGRIGQIVGCTARTVGFAMAALPRERKLPWQRVVNAQGRVSQRVDAEGNILQRDLLESEGIIFDRSQRIDLINHLWDFSRG